jgi:hypothetical protein
VPNFLNGSERSRVLRTSIGTHNRLKLKFPRTNATAAAIPALLRRPPTVSVEELIEEWAELEIARVDALELHDIDGCSRQYDQAFKIRTYVRRS